jgi:heme a synthase
VRLPLRSPLIATWLAIVALLIIAMVIVGGATRLTESGLSITEWKPVTGVMPPLSDLGWQQEFDKYKQIPQFSMVNSRMTVESFKVIYFWEWAHRLLARVVGLALFVPFIVFLLRSEVPARIIWRGVMLVALLGFQAFIGWWMVQSGLADNVSVAPERLATHLSLACLLLVLTVWTALEALSGEGRGRGGPVNWRIATAIGFGLISLQIFLGALVAGNDAGLVYNDWPMMNGHFAPYVDWSQGFGYLMFHDQGMVQFIHRISAYVLLAYMTTFAIIFAQNCRDGGLKFLSNTIATLLWCQAILGVATLASGVNIFIALLHQLGAVIVLVLVTILLWQVARADRDFK